MPTWVRTLWIWFQVIQDDHVSVLSPKQIQSLGISPLWSRGNKRNCYLMTFQNLWANTIICKGQWVKRMQWLILSQIDSNSLDCPQNQPLPSQCHPQHIPVHRNNLFLWEMFDGIFQKKKWQNEKHFKFTTFHLDNGILEPWITTQT
jgi:hypothetical protein